VFFYFLAGNTPPADSDALRRVPKWALAAAGSFSPPALARFRHGRGFQRHRRIDDRRVFAVQMRERQCVDILGRPALAPEIDLVDRL
jgi:hypothetical protein